MLPPETRETFVSASNSHPDHNRLIRKLETIVDLSTEEKEALLGLPLTIKTLGQDQDIVRDGDRPFECCLLVEGFACRYKLLADGRRQIMSFHIPGDIPDLQSLHLKVMDHSLGTLVRCKVAFIHHDAVRDLTRRCPRIADALWRDTLIDAAVFREWMIGMGRRSAYTRIAHLLCELLVRLRSVGLANGHDIEMPITQAELGDSLGLSTVHVNRVLQELRGDGLITLRGRFLSVQDWPALKQAGEFDPTYLHLSPKVQSVAA
jgi:CRP-like cAMP-binding protein